MRKISMIVFAMISLLLSVMPLFYSSFPKTLSFSQSRTPTPTPENPAELENLGELLSDKDCIHPCWFGLILGEDTLETAQQLVNANFDDKISHINNLPEEEGYLRTGAAILTGYLYIDSEGVESAQSHMLINFFAQEDSEVIIATGVLIEPYWSYIDWTAYSVPYILSVYGIPDEVTITYPMDGAHGAISASYDLTLRYFSLGIFVSYFTVIDETEILHGNNDRGLQICNRLDDLGIIQAWHQSEAMPDLEMTEPWDRVRFTPDYERPLNTVSNLTLAEFTEFMSQPDTCFTTLPPAEWEPPFNG